MNEKCFEQGAIQAFIDGETTPALSFEITGHAAACDKCAALIARSEEENEAVFAMLDREMNTLVPTQRLWNSITAALADEKKQASIWDRIRDGIRTAFASPSITVAASVLLVFGIFAAMLTLRDPGLDQPGPLVASGPVAASSQPTQTNIVPAGVPASSEKVDPGITETRYRPEKVKDLIRTAEYRPQRQPVRAQPAVVVETVPANRYMAGEESYLRTIASLNQSVDARKDMIMSPSNRIAFERDLAVVDDSISKMKQVVRKDPKNQAAKQVLYSSYQNKIDLLNSVVERGELMASLQ
ncbi:MAG: hypothetical protein IT173_16415 [Acidobacteria bacterium]|nr:hypothetical protein [Acidobacteriota bacterium]